MALRHFYINAPLKAAQTLALPQPLSHRLAKVLRLGEGAEIALFNGQNGLWSATLTDKACKHAHVGGQLKPQPAPNALTLVLGLPKREAWEAALRQATELGVAHIYPVATAYAQRAAINAARAQVILQEAAEQSERLTLPTLHPVQPFAAWLKGLQTACLWAHARGESGVTVLKAQQVLVGPEGGFSPAEEEALAAHPHISALHLPTPILRTDTAVVALLTTLVTHYKN